MSWNTITEDKLWIEETKARLKLTEAAYQYRDNPQAFYVQEYDRYDSKKWQKAVLSKFLKYPGWTDWLIENQPQHLI